MATPKTTGHTPALDLPQTHGYPRLTPAGRYLLDNPNTSGKDPFQIDFSAGLNFRKNHCKKSLVVNVIL
jgi:hypothetical protein